MVQFILDDIGGVGRGGPERRGDLVLACILSEMAEAPSSLPGPTRDEGSSNSGPG